MGAKNERVKFIEEEGGGAREVTKELESRSELRDSQSWWVLGQEVERETGTENHPLPAPSNAVCGPCRSSVHQFIIASITTSSK